MGSKIANLFANGSTIDDGTVINQKGVTVVFDWLFTALDWLANWIMTLFYWIVKFALNIIDLLQYFIERLVGIDVWQNNSATLNDITKNDILFKFLLSEEVIRVFRALCVIGIILLIVFSIIAIIRSEYFNAVGNEKNSNKKGILVSALKAIFLAVLVPLMTIFGILASNAVLASVLNAIRGNNNLTLGGQIFVASAYNANRYRLYADDDERQVATYDYTFAYNLYEIGGKMYYIPVDSDVIICVEPEITSDGSLKVSSYEKMQKFNYFYKTNLNDAANELGLGTLSEDDLSNKLNANTKFYTFCSQFEAINPSDYNASNMLNAFLYFNKEDIGKLLPTYYLAKFDITETNGIDKIAKFYYLNEVKQAFVLTSNLGIFQAQGLSELTTLLGGGAGETIEGIWKGLKNSIANVLAGAFTVLNEVKEWITGERSDVLDLHRTNLLMKAKWESSSIVLNSCFSDNPIVQAAYNTWGRASSYKGSLSMASTVEGTQETWTAANGNQFQATQYKNNTLWQGYDGGRYGFAPIVSEYEVMGDFIDYMVRYGVRAYIVSSQSPLIDWSVVNQKSYKYNESTGLYELCLNYENEGYVLYRPSNGQSEAQGAVFLVCYYNSGTGLYEPVVPNKKTIVDGVQIIPFTSDAYGYGKTGSDNPEGLVIARGVFERNMGSFGTLGQGYSNNPTIIEQLVKDGSGNVVGSNVAQYLNFSGASTGVSSSSSYAVLAKSNSGPASITVLTNVITISNVDENSTLGTYSLNYTNAKGEDLTFEDFAKWYAGCLGVDVSAIGYNNTFSNGTYSILRISQLKDGLTYYTDLYIYSNKINIIPYHIYTIYEKIGTSAAEGKYENISGNSLTDVIGTDIAGYAYIKYGTQTIKMRVGSVDNATFYYLNSTDNKPSGAAIVFESTTYKTQLYDAYGYKIDGNDGVYDFSKYDSRSYEGSSSEGHEYGGGGGHISYSGNGSSSASSVGYSVVSSVDSKNKEANSLTSLSLALPIDSSGNVITITDAMGNMLYGLKFVTGYNENGTATFYYNGQAVLKVEYIDRNYTNANRIDSFAKLYDLMTRNDAVTKENPRSYIKSYTIGSESYSTVPIYEEDNIASLAKSIKPSNILFVRDTVHTEFFTGDFSFLGAIRVKVGLFWLGTISGADDVLTWQIDNSTFMLDYNFNSKTGIGFDCLYRPANLNIIVLVASIVLVFKVLMQSAWGLVKRIYDITMLMMIMPGFCATMPIDNGDRFKKWTDNLVKTIFATYGVLIGLNIFFVLVPIIDSATANVFSYSAADYPATIRNSWLIRRPDYLNKLVGLMFTLVALTLIQTLPNVIADLLKSGDVYGEGEKVKGDVDKVVKNVGNFVSGQSLLDTKDKAQGMLKSFIPGSAIRDAWKEHQKKKKEEEKQNKHDWGDNTNFNPPPSEEDRNRQRMTQEGGMGYAPDGGGGGGNAGEAQHAFSSEMANSAGNLREDEEKFVQEFNGENKEQGPLAQMDTTESENAMAAFAEAFGEAEEAGDKAMATDAARRLTSAYEENVKANMNNAMLNDGGEFTAREDMLENVKKGLRDGYTATAYNTGEKDATGQDIWAVAIAKKTDKELGIENTLGTDKDVENKLTTDIKDYDKELRNLDSQASALDVQRKMAEADGANIDNEMAKFLKSDEEVEKYKQLAQGKANQQQYLATSELELTDLKTKRLKAQEQQAEAEEDIKKWQTKLNLAIQHNDTAGKEEAEKGLNRALQEKEGKVKMIAGFDEQIRQKEITVQTHKDQIAKSDLSMHQLIHGQNNAEFESVMKRKEENDAKIANIDGMRKNIAKEQAETTSKKETAEKNLEDVRKDYSTVSAARDVEKGNAFAARSAKAATEYEAAVKQQNNISGLSKIINGKYAAENKAKAVDAYINKYYAGASDKQKAELKASLSTSAGVAKHAKQVAGTVSTKRAIANGARMKANSYLGQTEAPPIMAHSAINNNGGGNGGGNGLGGSSSGGRTSGGSSGGSRTSGGTSGGGSTVGGSSSSSGSSGGGTYSNQYSEATDRYSSREDRTVKGLANRVKSGVVRKVTNARNAVVSAPGRIKAGVVRKVNQAGQAINKAGEAIANAPSRIVHGVQTALKPKTQGDKLNAQYRKIERAYKKGDYAAYEKAQKKMVKIAAKSTTMRDKADEKYINNINKVLGTNYTSVAEAKRAAEQAKTQTHSTTHPDGSTTDNTEQILKELSDADKERNSAYTRSSTQATRGGAEVDEKVLNATRVAAKKQQQQDLTDYTRRAENAGHNIVDRAINTVYRNSHAATASDVGAATRSARGTTAGRKATIKLTNSASSRAIRALNVGSEKPASTGATTTTTTTPKPTSTTPTAKPASKPETPKPAPKSETPKPTSSNTHTEVVKGVREDGTIKSETKTLSPQELSEQRQQGFHVLSRKDQQDLENQMSRLNIEQKALEKERRKANPSAGEIKRLEGLIAKRQETINGYNQKIDNRMHPTDTE